MGGTSGKAESRRGLFSQAPTGWPLKALHHLCRIKSGQAITAVELSEDGDFPVYGGNGLRGYFDQYTHSGPYVLIGRQGALCGNVKLVNGKFFASEHALVCHPVDDYDARWLGYVLGAMNLNQYSQSAAQPGLSAEVIGRLRLAVAPQDDQLAIAGYLDHKTAQIDALIAKKQALLDKLADKRASLISESITKGLTTSRQQIESGISWFGAIPSSWRIVPFKWCCRITEGQVDPSVPGYTELPLIAPNHIESGTGRLVGVETAEEQGAISGKYFYKAGAVLYSKIRPALVKACIAPSDGLCSADMYPIYPGDGLSSKFLLYQLLSHGFTQFAVLVSDRVAMPKVNREALGAFPIIVPPLEEQHQICEFLDRVIGRLDDQADRVRLAIAKLQEYRSSLITHAVTGQIDVRHVPIPEPAHA